MPNFGGTVMEAGFNHRGNQSISQTYIMRGFPGGSDGKESACNAGKPDSIPGSRRSPGGGHSNPLQFSCLENPMDRGVRQVTMHGITRVRHDLATKPPPPHNEAPLKTLDTEAQQSCSELLRLVMHHASYLTSVIEVARPEENE